MPPPTMTTSDVIGDVGSHDQSAARTRSSSAAMNVGEVFSDSVRRSVAASSRAPSRRLHVDVEQDFGVIADEPDRHDQKLADAAAAAVVDQLRRASGPIHGSGVRPAL